MPGKKHVKEWSVKRNRQYEHILKSLRESHPDWSEDKLKEMAARTVNKIRAEKGETKTKKSADIYHYNPVVDGPNPNGPNYLDNAENSYEQQLALQLWVNYAVELLNAGDEDKVILAKLTRSGCPNPQDVLLRAKMQPFEEPEQEVNTDMLPDEDNISPTAPVSTPDAEVNTTAPARQLSHKVRIKGSSETGTIIDMWHDVWGQSLIKVALDSGGTINVAPDAVEQYEDVIEVPHPVTQIQEFIDSLPEVKPTRPHIEARIANMELVRRAVADNINKVGLSDRVKLDKIDMDARAEISMLKEALKNICDETDLIYLNSLPIYQTHGISHPGVKRVVVQDEDFNNKIAEKAAIFVSELPQQLIEDPQSVAYAAFQYATANNGDAKRFMALVEEKRVARVALKNKEN